MLYVAYGSHYAKSALRCSIASGVRVHDSHEACLAYAISTCPPRIRLDVLRNFAIKGVLHSYNSESLQISSVGVVMV